MTASSHMFASDGVTLRASVVIPTYNRWASLERVLQAFSRQTAPASSFEVVVVADGCTDGTHDMCDRLASTAQYTLRLVEQSNAGPAAARNRGVQEASAELIVFVDDDVVPDEYLLETHLAAHASDASDNVVAIGPLLPPLDKRLNAWGAWEERTLCGHYAAMQTGRWQPTYRQFYSGNASLAKRLVLAAGGFDEQYLRAEDIELGLRLRDLGCTFAFLPEARGWHYVHRRFESWARMPTAYGAAVVSMSRVHGADLLAHTAFEYVGRSKLIRLCTRLCLGSRIRFSIAMRILQETAVVTWALRLSPLAYACCSLLYNLRLYDGLAAELGGVSRFWRLIETVLSTREKNGVWRNGAWHLVLAVAARLLGVVGEVPEPMEVGARS